MSDADALAAKRAYNNERNRIYHAKHRAAINARHRLWRAANREKLRAWQKAYRLANPEIIAATQKRSKAKRRKIAKHLGETHKSELLKNNIYAAASHATPMHLPRWIRDDVIAEIVLAVLEGKIALEQIAKRVREFITAHHRAYETYVTRSLDAPIPGTDGLTYLDRLAAPTQEAYE
jgi:hypothetical protein